MGLFDKFKKRVKEKEVQREITIEENTKEALLAITQRRKRIEEMQKQEYNKINITQTNSLTNTPLDDEWDDIDDNLVKNPFDTSKSSRERKRAQRQEAIGKASKSHIMNKSTMHTTTGRQLIGKHQASFTVDFSEEEVTRGGRVVKGGPILDEILEELEIEGKKKRLKRKESLIFKTNN